MSNPTPVYSVSLCYPTLVFRPFWPISLFFTLCDLTPCLIQHKMSLPVHVRLNRFYCMCISYTCIPSNICSPEFNAIGIQVLSDLEKELHVGIIFYFFFMFYEFFLPQDSLLNQATNNIHWNIGWIYNSVQGSSVLSNYLHCLYKCCSWSVPSLQYKTFSQ